MTNATHSAFPSTEDSTNGLTKLEYFAGLAMQALVNNNFSPSGFRVGDSPGLAIIAVECAKALIDELNNND